MADDQTTGVGLLVPFQRDQKEDFANGSGDTLTLANVGMVLGTRAQSAVAEGELEWRTNFGSRLYLIRQGHSNEVAQALAEFYVQEAFDNWLPELRLRSVSVERFSKDGRAMGLRLHVGFDPSGVSATSTPDGKLQLTVPLGQ